MAGFLKKGFIGLLAILFNVPHLQAQDKNEQLWANQQNKLVSGLVKASGNHPIYPHAVSNTIILQEALDNLQQGQILELPEGLYDIETLFIPEGLSDITITGALNGKTILRRRAFQWDNNLQGDCRLYTETMVASGIKRLTIKNLILDGNSYHLAISGYGKWNKNTGEFLEGLPQFPTFQRNGNYQGSSGSVLNIWRGHDISIHNVEVRNGFRWAVALFEINGLEFYHTVIETGKLSTEFRGHFDTPPYNTVMHMHTSQDGLHLVNVSNAVIEFNNIESEDSAIAIEYNARRSGYGFDRSENIRINNNYMRTKSPEDAEELLNDEDVIYGSGLADEWTGQSGVDIFYNEWYDREGKEYMGGPEAPIRNIYIFQNAMDGVRYGVRAGFFIGAGSYHCNHYNHRIHNLHIYDHAESFLAGKDLNRKAGIRNVQKNTHSDSWNQTGGAGIAIRNVDFVTVSGNEIMHVVGGLGISLVNVTDFRIEDNRINDVSGQQLGIPGWFDWEGGYGIQVWNDSTLTADPNLRQGLFETNGFVIKNNYINNTERNKITVTATTNGRVYLDQNFNFDGIPLCDIPGSLILNNDGDIDTGNCR